MGDGQFLVVFLSGAHDRMQMQPDGNTIAALTKTGKTFQMVRVVDAK